MFPIKLRKVSGRVIRLAVAGGVSAVAAIIGLVMQTGTPSEAAAVPTSAAQAASVTTHNAVNASGLPTAPSAISTPFPVQTVAFTLSEDRPTAQMPNEEPVPHLGCDISVEAEATIAALVDLTIHASCMPEARVAIEHAGLRFHEVLNADGELNLSVPALDEFAQFSVEFPNGTTSVAVAAVPSLVFYDRVAVQWLGETGLQIHALEFDADYGEDGHIWYGAPRDLTAVIGGKGGFLMRLGAGKSEISRTAEVYTFPTGNPDRDGRVALSIEAEVNGANCNKWIKADTIEVHGGGDKITNQFDMVMPTCDATGDFLVLKNLLQDLTIAQN